MNLLTEHARELLGMPPEWDSYEFEAIGRTDNTPAKLIRVSGAVAPPKTTGKNKGLPNWRKLDKATEKTAYFTPEEHDEWCKQWELKTRKCSKCRGKGQQAYRWSVTDGTSYKPCAACNATGQAPNALGQAGRESD